MGTLNRDKWATSRWGVIPFLVLSCGWLGCRTPQRTQGPAYAVALYREARIPTGALSFAHSTARARAADEGEVPAVDGSLSVDQAIARAKAHSARLVELRARVTMRSAETSAAGQPNNPELRVSESRADQVLDGAPRTRPSVRFRPNRPGELESQVEEARSVEREAQAALAAEELAIEADVRTRFDDLLILEAQVAAAEAVVTARRGLADRSRERLERSLTTALDASISELRMIDAEDDLVQRRALRDEARAALCDRVGLPPGCTPKPTGDVLSSWPPPALPSEQALIEAALRASPRVAAAAARWDGATARADAAQGRRWPWFTFVDVGYEFSPVTAASPGLGWTLQGGVELPVFDTYGEKARAADAARDAERASVASEAERIAREVRAKLRDVSAAAALVDDFRSRTASLIERAELAAKRALESREIDPLRTMAIEEQRVSVQLRLLTLIGRHRAALADLRRVIGGRLPGESTKR